jgi:hypothetical protein
MRLSAICEVLWMMRGADVPKTIPWTISVTPEGEQAIQKDDDMTVYDYYENTVTVHAESSKTVKIESSSGNPVWLLAIEPQYEYDENKPDNVLTCKFSDAETDVRLVKTLVPFHGASESELIGGALGGALQGLEFTNNTNSSLDVKVTVGIGAPADYHPPGQEDASQSKTGTVEETPETTSSPTAETT